MYNKTSILSCATSLVGFREDSNDIYDTLSDALKASTSGLYVNDLPAVSFEMIAANVSTDTTASDYLTNVVESETLGVVDKFVKRMKDTVQSKELLANKNIVKGVAPFTKPATSNARFVGYWLRPHSSNGLKAQINSIGVQASEIQSDLKIYLYVTSKLEPIQEYTFNVTAAKSLIWQDVEDCILNYDSDYGTGLNYLLGYYELDPDNTQDEQMQGNTYQQEFDCGCGNSPSREYGKYIGVQPVAIPNQYLNWNSSTSKYDIPLVDSVANFTSSQTHGLQAKMNVTCDITDVLCDNIGLFAEALQYAIATRILFDAYASNRINSISDSKREEARQFASKYDGVLNGYVSSESETFVKGLIDTLAIDFSSLDRVCLKCNPDNITRGNLVR